MDAQTYQKTVNELLQSKAADLDAKELELLTENSQYNQRISHIASQIQAEENQLESLKKERNRLEGVGDYLMGKAVAHRLAKRGVGGEPDGATKSTSTPRPPLNGGASKEEASPTGSEASPAEDAVIDMHTP